MVKKALFIIGVKYLHIVAEDLTFVSRLAWIGTLGGLVTERIQRKNKMYQIEDDVPVSKEELENNGSSNPVLAIEG